MKHHAHWEGVLIHQTFAGSSTAEGEGLRVHLSVHWEPLGHPVQ